MVCYRVINCIRTKQLSSCNSKWELFQIDEIQEVDLVINIKNRMPVQYGIEMFDSQPGLTVLKCENALLSVNDDWSEACVTLLDGKDKGLIEILSALIMTHLSTRNGLMIHSSLIDVDGKGIMFIGPSGIGKTTQAELWHQYRNACIINGDMALVHYDGKKYWGCGCPWHGSSPYCENKQVVLAGIVILEQAQENTLKRMQGVAMLEGVMRNVFLPKWYETGVEAVCETLDGLLSDVPVYLLKCRIDEEAVNLVERAIIGEDV